MSKRIVIVSGGELDEEFTLSVLEEGYSHIIGVDKGMEFLYQHQIKPSYIVGDFDSVDEKIRDYYRDETDVPIREFNPVKDASDTCLLYTSVLHEELENTKLNKPEEILNTIIGVANHELIKAAHSDVKLEGMGTTLVVATVIGNTLYFANVGDSRLYLINDKIRQLSKDHSLVEEMVRLGGIKAEEAKNHPDKNIITRAIGVKEDVEADIYEYRLKKGDVLLMCTDGLSNMVEDEDMFDIVKGARDIVEAVLMLIEKANSNGGRDNIGVVMAEPLADEVSVW